MAPRSYNNLIREPPSEEEVKALIASLKTLDDRSAAIVGSLLIEDALTTLLRINMADLSSDERKELFGPQCPLASFSAKIGIAYGFHLIERQTYKRLTAIKNVRNTFAHAPRTITFLNKEIEHLVKTAEPPNMLLVSIVTPRDHHQMGLLSGTRNLFLTLCRFYEKLLRNLAKT